MKTSTIRLIGIVISIQCFQGCATLVTLSPRPTPEQEVIFVKGTEHVVSKKENVVSVGLCNGVRASRTRPEFIVFLSNKTEEPINFSTENVRAKANGDDLKVYTYDELQKEAQQQYALAMFFVGLGGVARSMNAANAGYQYHSGTINYYGSGGYGSGVASYSGVTYDAGVAQMAQMQAQAQTNAEMAQVTNRYRESLANLDAAILQKTTVQSETTFGGIVVVEKTKCPKKDESNEVEITVNLGEESHEFAFQETQATTPSKKKNTHKK
jgi:hypothetical protein